MRKTYICRNGEVVEKPDVDRSPKAPMFMPDIEPYRSPVHGTPIHSRPQRRDDLKRHGMIETPPEWNPSNAKS